MLDLHTVAHRAQIVREKFIFGGIMEFIAFKRQIKISHPAFFIAYVLAVVLVVFYLMMAISALSNRQAEVAQGLCIKGAVIVALGFVLHLIKNVLGIKIFEEYWISKKIYHKREIK